MRARYPALLLAAALPGSVFAGQRTPTVVEMKKIFSTANQSLLCKNGSVDAGALLGQLSIVYELNPYAMPKRKVTEAEETVPAALRGLDWILHVNSDDSVDPDARKLLGVQHERLVNVGTNLAYELKRLQEAPHDSPYQLDRTTSPVTIDTEPQRNRALRRLFAPLLGTIELDPLEIRCVVNTKTELVDDDETGERRPLVFSVRGKYEDLAVNRPVEKSGYETDLYKLASSATVALTDNDVSDVATSKAEAALGVSTPIGTHGFGSVFLHYLANTTETRASDDEDDSKDTNAFSYGVMYRQDFEWGDKNALLGTFSASAFETLDHAQDAELVRGRVSFSDLSISRLGKRALCGVEAIDGPVWYQCRLGVFGEYGRVQDAGRSVDYQTLADDTYTGAGVDFGFAIAPLKPEGLAPLTLTLNYRYMHVVSGDLEDPEWWSAKLSFDIPKSNFSVGLLYEKGENAVTFEEIETTTLNFGFKY